MEQFTKASVKNGVNGDFTPEIEKLSEKALSGSKWTVNANQRFAWIGFIGLNAWVWLSLRHDGFLQAQILPACLIISCVLLLKAFQR